MKNRLTQEFSESDNLKKKFKKLEMNFQTVLDENTQYSEVIAEYERRLFNYEKVEAALERTSTENTQHQVALK